VAIARALMGDHAMLLCDEPTGNLDSANSESVLALFDQLGAGGLTLVIVTHEEQVAAHARRRVRMIDGRLYEDEP
jgi:putative ABC transport system ATP-binding protein